MTEWKDFKVGDRVIRLTEGEDPVGTEGLITVKNGANLHILWGTKDFANLYTEDYYKNTKKHFDLKDEPYDDFWGEDLILDT